MENLISAKPRSAQSWPITLPVTSSEWASVASSVREPLGVLSLSLENRLSSSGLGLCANPFPFPLVLVLV